MGKGLEPFARFLGDWEGTSESVAGTFHVAKRFQWLVPDSWLLEQTVTMHTESGQEMARTALLYTYDPNLAAVLADELRLSGVRQRLFLHSGDHGATWEVRSQPGGEAEAMFTTTLFTGDEWRADSFQRDAGGGWRQVEHMELQRKR
ncbi:MAG: hypothetical protein EYC70_10580 [Planctomycetota bacterium]|nr:MAG: hypothetical protein EYC70_10580 [Planctomycetota bacterium]